jgi:cytochrome oxidase Cu insertion factor (SCO1/SenC/PrrC family)
MSPDPPPPGGAPAADRGPVPAVKVVLLAVFALLTLTLVASLLWFVRGAQRPPLPVLSEVPEFDLVDRDGRAFTLADLEGRPWIADFIFTRCYTVCPRMTQQLAKLKPLLPEGVGAVSFSVDPEYDTPEVLAEYAERHGADADWHFLTGDLATLDALTRKAFLLPLDRSPDPEVAATPDPILHSNRFVLVDGEARIRGYYDGFDPAEVERLLGDVRRLP